MTTIQDVLVYIATRAATDEIGLIYDTCKDRSKALRNVAAAVNLASLKPGDRVVLHSLSPKLLNGASGTITMVNAKSVDLDLDDNVASARARARNGSHLRGVPASCVTKEA